MKDELLEWRTRLVWTQRQAAEYLDVPLATYKGWEQGRREVQNAGPVRRLIRLAFHGFTAHEIMQKTKRGR